MLMGSGNELLRLMFLHRGLEMHNRDFTRK
jgi:hypothetical protein